jgi:hypothetical protein
MTARMSTDGAHEHRRRANSPVGRFDQSDSAALAELAKGRMRTKIPDLRKALTDRFREHRGFLLKQMWTTSKPKKLTLPPG